MTPTLGHGKICYIEVPATDIEHSANFYKDVFGWNIRKRSNGETSFDDGVGQVSGVWVLGLPPLPATGLSIHIMVDDMDQTLAAIVARGCEIVEPVGKHAPEITAKFRDPGGNVFGVYQNPV